MTLEELWQLFPVILAPHDPAWKEWYAEEEELIRACAGEKIVRISHIGSTAIPGIRAKPTVDILLETEDPDALPDLLSAAGFRVMSRGAGRISFNKGYTPEGYAERVFHLHARLPGDCDELYFRDWMQEHPEDAAEYEKMKFALRKEYEHDRDGYTDAKAGFVARITELAKKAYGKRY